MPHQANPGLALSPCSDNGSGAANNPLNEAMVSSEELSGGLLFSSLSEQQLQRVASHASSITRTTGVRLFAQGEPANRFYLLLQGQIKLFRLSPEGNEKIIEIITPPNSFGEALMFLDRPCYPVGAQALVDSRLIAIDSADFTDMLRNSSESCLSLLGVLSQRLHGLIGEIDQLTLHSAACRVAAYLHQQSNDQYREFELSMSKGVLASRLSVTPETLSRILKQLSASGIIKVSGRRVEVLDAAELKEAAST